MAIHKVPVVGDIYHTSNSGMCTILEYNSARDVVVEFKDTGYITRTRSECLRNGQVRDLYHPSIKGVGYLGEGLYRPYITPSLQTPAYRVWNNMITRCYCPRSINKQPTYMLCTVCESWLNFQTFAMWFYNNYIEEYELDKDLLVKGNKVYSPSTCLFIPKSVNLFIVNRSIGDVAGSVGAFPKSNGKFAVTIKNTISGCHDNLGTYTTEVSAHAMYSVAKFVIASKLASRLQEKGDVTIAKALRSYYSDVEIPNISEVVKNAKALAYIKEYKELSFC